MSQSAVLTPADTAAQLEQARKNFLAACPAEEEAQPSAEPTEQRSFTLLSGADVLALKSVPWRVKDILPASGLAAIFGQPGSAKTFIALDMAFAVAEGAEWFDMRTHACPVLYVNLESSGGLKKRLAAWQTDRKRLIPDAVRFVIEPFHILEDVDALARGIEPGTMIFLDTLNAAAPGLDENSSRDMGLILEAAKKLQRLTEGLVVLVHHCGKDANKGLRGHSSLLAALDAAVEVGRNNDARYWRITKAKEAEDGKRRGFRLKTVGLGYDEDHEPEISCVVEPDNSPTQEEEKPLTPTLTYALGTLKTALEEEKTDSVHVDVWRNHYYARHTADNTHAKKTAFLRVRKELSSLGKITVLNDCYSIPGTAAQPRHNTGTCAAAQNTNRPAQPAQHPLGCVPCVPSRDGGAAYE